MSDEDDPFERLDDVEREGDPFEQLDPDDAGEGAEESTDGTDEPDHRVPDDPFAEMEREPSAASGAETGADDTAPTADDPAPDRSTDPFDDFDQRDEDPFGTAESVFERVDVGSVDADEVWASIDDDADDESAVPDADRYAEVSKHAFCERCPHFSEPPDAHCTHETAELVEFLDMERVRLLDCPIVAERQDLE